jgi:hypothetical protein
MTKEEITAVLAASAIRALDVCTPAERALIDAVVDVPWGAPSTRQQEINYKAAYEAVLAERTPPDPVETFIAEVREALDARTLSIEQTYRAISAARFRLDAARGRK